MGDDQGDVAHRVDARQGGTDLRRLGEVDGEALALGMQLGGDAGAAFLVATGDHDPLSALQAELGQVPSEPRRAADDERRSRHFRPYSSA